MFVHLCLTASNMLMILIRKKNCMCVIDIYVWREWEKVCVCVNSLFERFAVRWKMLQNLKRYIGYLIYHYRPDVVVSKSTWTQRQNLCCLAKISQIFIRLVFVKIFPDLQCSLSFSIESFMQSFLLSKYYWRRHLLENYNQKVSFITVWQFLIV